MFHELGVYSTKNNIEKKCSSTSYTIADFTKFPSPRFIHTQLPFDLLPRQIRTGQKKSKIIYIISNAKDVCVEYSGFYTFFGGFIGTLNEFCSLFLSGKSKFINFRYIYINDIFLCTIKFFHLIYL